MKKPEPIIDLASFYLGRSLHVLDGSNRIMMPAAWKVPGSPKQFHVVLWEDHLVILPPGMFTAFLEKLRTKTDDKTEIPEIERQLNQLVRLVNLDPVSRLPLPREFTAAVGIEKQAEMVGRFSKFEVWSPSKLQEPNPIRDAAKTTINQGLREL